MCILADVTCILGLLQKNLQKDSRGLADVPKFTDYTLEQLDSLVHSPLTEETFKNEVDSNTFYGIQFWKMTKSL